MSEMITPVPEPMVEPVAVPEPPKSKYTFIETETGCRIEREGGLVMTLEYRDTFIYANATPYGIYTYRKLLEYSADWFAGQLVSRKRDVEQAAAMIGSALSHRLYVQWKRIVETIVPPEVEKLARLMWASTQGDSRVLHQPDLYTEAYDYARRDMAAYHACRMFLRAIEETGCPNDQLLDYALEWRKHLTPTVPNKALNKTLDRVPMGISFRQILSLTVMHLHKPITKRLPLIFALACAEHHNWGVHEDTVLKADAQAVVEACQIMGVAVNGRSRTSTIQRGANLILDYALPFDGSLVGLARRSREWHREADQMEAVGLPDDYTLPMPDIDFQTLGKIGIRPLRTAGEVYEEGRRMHHCVASYASKAATGKCYLFHVELGNDRATVEMSAKGHALQAYGPTNMQNKACGYGVRVLTRAFAGEPFVLESLVDREG